MTKQELVIAIHKGMTIENENFEFDIVLYELCFEMKSVKPVRFKNCNINIFDCACFEFQDILEFDHCTFLGLAMHGTTIHNGLKIKNCNVKSYFDLSCSIIWSGNNCIDFTENVFEDLLTFEDTNFHDPLTFKNNQFFVGCDLQTEKQLRCDYPNSSLIIENEGNLKISELEQDKHWMRIRNLHNTK